MAPSESRLQVNGKVWKHMSHQDLGRILKRTGKTAPRTCDERLAKLRRSSVSCADLDVPALKSVARAAALSGYCALVRDDLVKLLLSHGQLTVSLDRRPASASASDSESASDSASASDSEASSASESPTPSAGPRCSGQEAAQLPVPRDQLSSLSQATLQLLSVQNGCSKSGNKLQLAAALATLSAPPKYRDLYKDDLAAVWQCTYSRPAPNTKADMILQLSAGVQPSRAPAERPDSAAAPPVKVQHLALLPKRVLQELCVAMHATKCGMNKVAVPADSRKSSATMQLVLN